MKQTAGKGQLAHGHMSLNADQLPIEDCGCTGCQAGHIGHIGQIVQIWQDGQDGMSCALPPIPYPQRRASCAGTFRFPSTHGAWPHGFRRHWQAGTASAFPLATPPRPLATPRPVHVKDAPVLAGMAQVGLAHAGRFRQAARTLGLGLALLLALPFAGGCAARQEAPVIDEAQAFVDRRLMEAGDAIARDLALLAGSRSLAGSPAAPAPGSPLAEPLSLHWDGPLEGALAQVCALAGLKLAIAGRPPDMAPQVHVRTARRPCRDILEDLSRQAGPCARLSVDAQARLVRLWYLEPPETLRGQARAKPAKPAKPGRQGRPAPSEARPQPAIP